MEKANEIELTKNKCTWTIEKWKIIHPPASEESHPVTSPLEETVGILWRIYAEEELI